MSAESRHLLQQLHMAAPQTHDCGHQDLGSGTADASIVIFYSPQPSPLQHRKNTHKVTRYTLCPETTILDTSKVRQMLCGTEKKDLLAINLN